MLLQIVCKPTRGSTINVMIEFQRLVNEDQRDLREKKRLEEVGFVYLRYVTEPKTLWSWYEPYIN